MVKCPRASLSQIKANLAYLNKTISLNFESSTHSSTYDAIKGEKESETFGVESEDLELDSVKADKRSPPTAQDEVVYFFIECFLEILLESWEGKPCIKQKVAHVPVSKESEEYGEDLGPCEMSLVSSTTDYLKDLYQKRSSNLSKEKLKKNSESFESEYLEEEEDFESTESPDVGKVPYDEEVHFVFVNGVWYKGRVSRRLMEGLGFYFWEDGSSYEGEFEGGFVTGNGRLEFPDLSVYEGGVYKAFRHGEGMYCFSDSPVMYSGQWWLGKKHGQGLIVYNDPSESHNFYKGQWQNGVKEGFGFRQYPSGAKYIGFWSNGKRHGRGVMFWSNHDIYRGDWKGGVMHGYGEYTWNGFINKSLSYPASNTYRGYWTEGKRNGRGIFELKSGPAIETFWVDDMKEGLGAVICENGTIIASEELFKKDKPVCRALQIDESVFTEPSTNLSLNKKRSRGPKGEKITECDSSIPIHSPVHTISLKPHVQKFEIQIQEKALKRISEQAMEARERVTPDMEGSGDEAVPPQLSGAEYCQLMKCVVEEEKSLRNCIISNMFALRACYDHYAEIACATKPSFKCVLLRLFLWQMLIDADVPSSSLSLVQVDNILACEEYILLKTSHDPFEQIQFWQFIHILIVLSWYLYGRFVTSGPDLGADEKVFDFLSCFEQVVPKNTLKGAFEYFIQKNVFKGRFLDPTLISPNESWFEESDFVPIEAMYVIYCNIGEPHSVRDFVKALCTKEPKEEHSPDIVRYFEKLPNYKIEGRNALTVAGELQHIPEKEPFNYPEILELEKNREKSQPKSVLNCFKGLKAKRILKCLSEVCKGVVDEDYIVKMDYQLTFLEFYKIVILCAKLQLKINKMNELREGIISEYKSQLEEYKKQCSEYEKARGSSSVSRRKSRQFSDLSKKGKK